MVGDSVGASTEDSGAERRSIGVSERERGTERVRDSETFWERHSETDTERPSESGPARERDFERDPRKCACIEHTGGGGGGDATPHSHCVEGWETRVSAQAQSADAHRD